VVRVLKLEKEEDSRRLVDLLLVVVVGVVKKVGAVLAVGRCILQLAYIVRQHRSLPLAQQCMLQNTVKILN
jgi:hypothetical protein